MKTPVLIISSPKLVEKTQYLKDRQTDSVKTDKSESYSRSLTGRMQKKIPIMGSHVQCRINNQ